MTAKDLKKFLAARPLLSVAGIEKEAGIQQAYLHRIIAEDRRITPKMAARLLPVLEKYGWESAEH